MNKYKLEMQVLDKKGNVLAKGHTNKNLEPITMNIIRTGKVHHILTMFGENLNITKTVSKFNRFKIKKGNTITLKPKDQRGFIGFDNPE